MISMNQNNEDVCDYCHQAFIMCNDPNCDENCLGHHRDLSGFYCSDRCWCLSCGTPLDQVNDMPLATKTQQGKYKYDMPLPLKLNPGDN